MSILKQFNDDQELLQEGRRGSLGSEQDQEENFEVPLRQQISQTLKRKLEDEDVGLKVVENWNMGNAARQERLERRQKLLKMLDEHMDPIYNKPQEWMSDLHVPISFMVSKVFHARMYQAIMGEDPSFQVKAEKEANIERASMIQQLMGYTIKRWANNYQGIEDAIDKYVWEWCTMGRGILKLGWSRRFTRFVDIQTNEVEVAGPVVDGQQTVTTTPVEEPIKRDEKIFDGPVVHHVPEEDILILGGDGNPDNADFVCHQIYMTAHDLWTSVDQGLFDKKAVEEVIDGGNNEKTAEPVNDIKQDRANNSGESNIDQQEVIDRYQILEAYAKVSLDNSGIESDVVVWVHKETKQILRAVYLYNINKTGTLPFAVADFHKRQGQSSAVGLVELIYSIQQEMDAMHNMKVDSGLLSSLPFGYYKPSAGVQTERLPIEPGNLIPLNDPQRDVFFPNLGNRGAFAAQEEQALFQIISRITGLGDLNFGIIGAQGAARTATGARAIINESNANLDIFLRRVNRGFKKALVYTYQMLRQRMPNGMEFRVTGDDGNQEFVRIKSREELAGMFDFEVEPNSSNSNQQIRIQRASQTFQVTQNPLFLQLGIVTPYNAFEAAKNLMEAQGIKDWSRYLAKPQNQGRVFLPEELGNRVLAGVDVQLDPTQDLDGFVQWAQSFMDNDELVGQFDEAQIVALNQKMREAQQLLQALQQVKRQAANAQQIQTNSGLATAAGAPASGQVGGGQNET